MSTGTGGSSGRERVELRRALDPETRRRRMAEDVRDGLGTDPKILPPKYFYDARGSRLFEEITRLPEYYQTRTERRILEERAEELVAHLRPRALVEYGSGSAGKTRVLLDAMHGAGLLEGYGPIDVSPEPLRAAAEEIAERYPDLRVVATIGDFETPLPLPFEGLPRLVLFLGGTIGNFRPRDAVEFLARVRHRLGGDDGFLIGFDLVKERERLEAAYDDAAGVTAAFNRNVLRVLNAELDAEFDPEAFEHRAVWNEEESRIEMHLVARRPQRVRIAAIGMEVAFEAGETIRTELSHKYTRDSVSDLLRRAGLRLVRWETDPEGLFAVGLAAGEGGGEGSAPGAAPPRGADGPPGGGDRAGT